MSDSGDCIFREDIVNGVNDLYWNSTRDYEPHEIILALHDMIADIPAADVRPVVRGKWIDHQEGRWIYAKCSECGTVHDVKSNFCPNCGADMRPEDGE